MNSIDWIIVVAFFVAILLCGVLLVKRSKGNMTDFFLAGRKLPWWLSGLSMMATNFASDTPLHSAGNAHQSGLIGWWFYMRYVLTGNFLGFFFARLWRRTNILTDMEFFELRHGAGAAKLLRGTLASYYCFIYIPLKIGLFTLAMRKIAEIVLGLPPELTIIGYNFNSGWFIAISLVGFAMLYSAMSGLWGVVVTDMLEWVIAIFGSYALMIMALKAVGGPGAMVEQLQMMATDGRIGFDPTQFVPHTLITPVMVLMIATLPFMIGTDGELAVAQRLMACRSETDAMFSQFMRMISNFVVRSWPWLICGLASIIIFEGELVSNVHDIYPMMIRRLLPHGLLGLMIASFMAAFLSSADTYMNLGAAYFINDLYKRFLVRNKTEGHYVTASRLATVAMAITGVVIACLAESVFDLFKLLLMVGAGVGIVRILRWYWWRINGLAEFTSLVVAAVAAIGFELWRRVYFTAERAAQIARGIIPTDGIRPPAQWLIDILQIKESIWPEFLYFFVEFALICLIVTVAWLIVLVITKPDPTESLKEFYRRVRPAGPGWKPIAKLCPEVKINDSLLADSYSWLVGCVFTYAAIFCAGSLYFTRWKIAIISFIICLVVGVFLKLKILKRYEQLSTFDREQRNRQNHIN